MDQKVANLSEQIENICLELVEEKGSNQKARKYLREQLWFLNKNNTHALIKLMIVELERLALSD